VFLVINNYENKLKLLFSPIIDFGTNILRKTISCQIAFLIFAKKNVMSDFNTLAIKKYTRETPSAVSITFDVPSNIENIYSFLPGQYITIKTQIEGKEVRRAYSICSSPKSNELTVAIKAIEGGTFSVFANTALSTGDLLDIHVPEGNFVLQSDTNSNQTYAAFAAGSGITPIMSMVKSVLESTASKFVLVYGNKNPKETIFLNELLALQKQYPDRFFLELFYSRSNEGNANFGRIEKSTINDVLSNKFKDIDFHSFYLCGPEEMINTASEVLIDHGVEKSNIHFELFTASATKEDITIELDGSSDITILVDDEEFSFAMDQKKTILEAALEKDIDAPYSCQGGVCSSCICKVTEGSAIMDNNIILTDEEIKEGLVLACKAYPSSAKLTVDFDDV